MREREGEKGESSSMRDTTEWPHVGEEYGILRWVKEGKDERCYRITSIDRSIDGVYSIVHFFFFNGFGFITARTASWKTFNQSNGLHYWAIYPLDPKHEQFRNRNLKRSNSCSKKNWGEPLKYSPNPCNSDDSVWTITPFLIWSNAYNMTNHNNDSPIW